MDNHTSTSRAEAERLLALAEKLLANKDLSGSKQFAILAQEAEPLLEGSDQIVAIIDVLSASQNQVNHHPNWYQILQTDPKLNDLDFIKKQYRRLALLLHPDKNKFAFAESAFHLVADAWSVLSDPVKKSVFDNELGLNFTKVNLEESRMRNQNEMRDSAEDNFPASGSGAAGGGGGGGGGYSSAPKKRGRPKGSVGKGTRKVGVNGLSVGGGARRELTFWTGCPYCYNLYEYPRKYEGCCLRCTKCRKGFTAEGVGYEPPTVPGKEEYYCCWGMFPMGFADMDRAGRGRGRGRGRGMTGGGVNGFVNSMPTSVGIGGGRGNVNLESTPKPKVPVTNGVASVAVTPGVTSAPKRGRGRPRKNPLPQI